MNKKQKIESSNKPTFVRTWGQTGKDDGQFRCPYNLVLGYNGNVYVADSWNHRIQYFTADGTFIRKWGSEGSADGQFNYPTGLAIGVDDAIKNRMMSVPELASFPPGVLPICVAYVGVERIYVVDSNNNRIQVFELDGRFIRKWGSRGSGDGQFYCPWTCAIGYESSSEKINVIYVMDRTNLKVQVFDMEGKFIRKWGNLEFNNDKFNGSFDMCINKLGLIYITCRDSDRVMCYRSDCSYQRSNSSADLIKVKLVTEWRPQDNLFSGPSGIVVHDELNGSSVVYVVDSKNHCIKKLQMNGEFVSSWGSMGIGDGEFHYPMGITRGKDVLYVADTYNNRIVVIDCF